MNQPAAKASFKSRQWDYRHDAIIDAAQELMNEKGYIAMSIDDLVAAVGISKPTLYVHFSGKEEIGVAVLLRMIANTQREFASLMASLPPGEATRAMIGWMIDRRYSAEHQYNYMGASPLFQHESIVAGEEALVDALAVDLARGQEHDVVRRDVSARLLGRMLLSVIKDPVQEVNHRLGTLDPEKLKEGLTTLLMRPVPAPALAL